MTDWTFRMFTILSLLRRLSGAAEGICEDAVSQVVMQPVHTFLKWRIAGDSEVILAAW